jgi:hypothetical protein
MEYHAVIQKITLKIKDFSKIPKISNDVKEMLRSNEQFVLKKELPCCFMSGVLSSYGKLSIAYNIKNMVCPFLYYLMFLVLFFG